MQVSGSNFNNTYQAMANAQAVPSIQIDKGHAPTALAQSPSEQVSISAQAQQMYASETGTVSKNGVVTLPVEPDVPPIDKDKVNEFMQSALEIKKIQAEYQVASDMFNIVTGSSDGISSTTAYAMSNNEALRTATVDSYAMKNQADLFGTYAEATKQYSEQYQSA